VFSHHDYDTTISKYAMEMAIGWFRILGYYPLIIGSMLQHCFVYRSQIDETERLWSQFP
jgi:hypothetical protein